MIRRLIGASTLFAALATGGWNFAVSQYFGRVDVERWAKDHPAPPPPRPVPGPLDVAVIATRQVVPGPGLPAGITVQDANNNLDVVRHADGRVYLAWRTAPHHFASGRTAIHVVSSTDEEHWRAETSFSDGHDLREPRLLSYDGHLLLYVARLEARAFSFRPRGVSASGRRPDGTWTPFTKLPLGSFIAWRTRVDGGRPVMIGYAGGENLYALAGGPTHVQVLTSTDGRQWVPAFGADPTVVSGGTEMDYARLGDGSIVAVTRNEGGDGTGLGSKVCRATADGRGPWTCVPDRRRFDSPLVFAHAGEVYLIARRHVTEDGLYDVASGPGRVRLLRDELAYITEAKRCSLWHYDARRRAVDFVLDLPSRGDTCFASVLATGNPAQLAVYDYSSPVDGPDMPWAAGQRRPTRIYRHVLRFTPSPTAVTQAR